MIVPVYNVEEYVEEAVRSVLRQTLADLEVIIIDDGSTDGSSAIVDRLAGEDGRVRVIRKANAGLGAARNTGIREARGRYLTFIDSDDTIPTRAYEIMVRTLEKTGSDFAVGSIVRFRNGSYFKPNFDKYVHRRERLHIRIDDFPDAVQDVIACNRMFRTEFWRERIGDFTEGVAYEDHVPMMLAYARADAFDILAETTYDWRVRENLTSIGQQKHEIQNLRDRLHVKELAETALKDEASPAVYQAWIGRVLGIDLPAFIGPALEADDEYRQELHTAAVHYLAQADDDAWDQVSAYQKVIVTLLAEARWDELPEVMRYFVDAGWSPRARAEDGFVVLDRDRLPAPLDRFPSERLRMSRFETELNAAVERVVWAGDRLKVHGWAFIPGLDLEDETSNLEIALVGEDGTRRPLEVERSRTDRASAWGNHGWARYEESGFSVVIDPSALPDGFFHLEIVAETGGVVRSGPVTAVVGGTSADVGPWRSPRRTGRGWTHAQFAPDFGVQLAVGGRKPRTDLTIDDLGRMRRALRVLDTRVTHADVEDGHLVLRLRGALPTRILRTGLSLRSSARRHTPTEVRRLGRETIVRFAVDPEPGRRSAFSRGTYRLVLQLGAAESDVIWAREATASLPIDRSTSTTELELRATGKGEVRVAVPLPMSPSLRSRPHQARLREAYRADVGPLVDAVVFQCYQGEFASDNQLAIFEEMRRRGLVIPAYWAVRDLSVQIPDAAVPLVIGSVEWYERLATAKLLCNNIDFPDYFRRRDGQRFLQTFHGHPFKSMGMSAWRSSGANEDRVAQRIVEKNAAWTDILVANAESGAMYRREFDYRGRILETGYPRDDVLANPQAGLRDSVRRELGIAEGKTVVLYAPTWRESLQTGGWDAAAYRGLDLPALSAALGENTVILARGHNFNERKGDTYFGTEGVLDVTSYPEVNDLVIASDVAVLDYSSLRFDYAITGKPMVFFSPDEEEYFRLRPALMPYRETTPGPVVTDLDALVDALSDLDALRSRHAEELRRFNERFNRLNDGHAADRVVSQWVLEAVGEAALAAR
ncbi:bifunctional glycosyltransferase/CDP-glycerol:glycerophosphate glycerophosphotransferase [Agromyces archimandritae]|uniref:CDP-glycerol glycerophosphotransferase family protein n=1 Tax=Agromyces archimandritae TaxID=2781962 RepID=A0A975FPI0_9MICO|nr:CDP-glycerol glycerophosphotransferase family protein [Agromyces archimandritae]QTX05278.1 CDP-glycerol glycerophosphotransferase family protein [Agromyces archimandritae]